MRSTKGVRQARTWRKLAAVAALAVLGTAVLGTATVTGANSRILYVGTGLVDGNGAIVDQVNNGTGLPPADGVPDNAGALNNAGIRTGRLIPTPVNAGYATAIPIQVLNGDNQTVAHVVLTFVVPSGTSFSYLQQPNLGTCTTVGAPVTSISCNFANLGAGAVRSFFIVVSTTVANAAPNIFNVQVNTNNENGSNLQVFEANSGGFQIQGVNGNGLSDFVPPGQAAKAYNTAAAGGSNKLQTKLDFNQATGGNLVQIAENEGTVFQYACPSGLTCQPFETTVTVQDGLTGSSATFGSPFLTVTLSALVPKTYSLNKAFVAHYGASTTSPDWVLSWSDKATRCGNNPAAKLATIDQCFNSATLGRANADGLQPLVLQVILKHNGGIRM